MDGERETDIRNYILDLKYLYMLYSNCIGKGDLGTYSSALPRVMLLLHENDLMKSTVQESYVPGVHPKVSFSVLSGLCLYIKMWLLGMSAGFRLSMRLQ